MRKILLSLLVTLAVAVVPAVSQAASKRSFQATSEQRVIVLLNEIRREHGLGDFKASAPLRTAARFHSADMLQKGYFEHDSPTEAWDARVSRYLEGATIGENIAWGSGSFGSPEGIVSQWMHSPPHRRIILTAGLHRIGLGIAAGTFDGTPGAVLATADFAG
ncbi:MAG: hypothetical protein QOE87_2830 [Gaiellales bacterium]|nr:hypothetical protein [Gaiellales bacterium]